MKYYRVEVQPSWSTTLWAKVIGEMTKAEADDYAKLYEAKTRNKTRVVPVVKETPEIFEY